MSETKTFEQALREKLNVKARRPMQEAGICDPMEQSGNADMITIDDAIKACMEANKEWLTQKCQDKKWLRTTEKILKSGRKVTYPKPLKWGLDDLLKELTQ